MQLKTSIRWALIAGFLGLIWGTHLITTTSSYLTSQKVLRQHARDIMKNIAELALEQSQRHLLHAHGAAALTRLPVKPESLVKASPEPSCSTSA